MGNSIPDYPNDQLPIFLLRNLRGQVISEQRSPGQILFSFIFSKFGEIKLFFWDYSQKRVEPSNQSITLDPQMQFFCIPFRVLTKISERLNKGSPKGSRADLIVLIVQNPVKLEIVHILDGSPHIGRAVGPAIGVGSYAPITEALDVLVDKFAKGDPSLLVGLDHLWIFG